ncbi:DNA helicase HerA-like ATPase [Actinocorallia herbida]|uniref:DNA helicase HerA-like ATPase n=1 Tax=Actinocorallia herbida TaxID=58109 RepID=A0A3N1D7C7_9ACTN|nr:ATP-binding protein [Actinocorallia herbida]ROO89437.1 DNA helicase HerA-like ATPase [Actinocorallia herbida]
MNEAERRALKELKAGLDWAATAEHAWRPSPYHVDGLHPRAEEMITDGIAAAARSRDASPLGVAVQGEGGTGKTHLLGWVRQTAERRGGYFFLVDFSFGAGEGFWPRVARAMVQDLDRVGPGGLATQAATLLRRLSLLADLDERQSAALSGEHPCTKDDVEALVRGLYRRDRALIARCADTLRALALVVSPDLEMGDIGRDYLGSVEESEPGERQEWGIGRRIPSPQDVVVDLSAVLALTGPSVIAIDQIDALLEHSSRTSVQDGDLQGQEKTLLEEVAGGLMELRHVTRRSLCLVASLPTSWLLVERQAVTTVQDRFRTSLMLGTITDAATAQALVERRLSAALEDSGFTPAWPGWPVTPEAYATAEARTPRELMKRIDAHLQACLRDAELRPLTSFATGSGSVPLTPGPPAPDRRSTAAFADLDARFAELKAGASVEAAFDHKAEDVLAPGLLAAGLTAWIREAGPAGRAFSVDPPPGRRPVLHARLRQTLDPVTERQRHWSFRMIGAAHHGSALKRLRDALTESGRGAAGERTLIIVRNLDWAEGPATREQLGVLTESGGKSLTIGNEDLRTFAALAGLLAEPHPDLDDWLAARRPAGRTEFLTDALAGAVPEEPGPAGEPDEAEEESANRVLPLPLPSPEPASGPYAPAPSPPSGLGGPESVPPLAFPVPQERAEPTRTNGTARPGPQGATVIPFSQHRAGPAHVTEPSLGPAPGAPFVVPFPPPGDSPAPPRTFVPSPSVLPFAPPPPAVRLPREDEPIRIGMRAGGEAAVTLDPAVLTRHTAIFAGSGSGKTVLIRRLVEECALRGVSSIVLDPNNDLARLGDAWPAPPEGWTDGDAGRAALYHEGTEVVVWTPGRAAGRPLSFQPLPDLTAVQDDPDEFTSALDLAMEELSPRAGTEANTAQAPVAKAVLREALAHFARRGGGNLTAFLALLGDLPFEASRIAGADEFALKLAQRLTAATINDPLFAGDGEPVDPRSLLTPGEGKRARISVISLAGLTEERRPDFVRRLQMALFSWIKRNPARDRPLGGLFVMDEAQTLAPATPRTPALASTLTLASQARKYGLGLVFATQAPKGLHNQVSGNATTQFIGRLNAPAQITAAKELARARGGGAARVGKLQRGQFYVASEGLPEALTQTPLCLSHHPAGPLNESEILARARRS